MKTNKKTGLKKHKFVSDSESEDTEDSSKPTPKSRKVAKSQAKKAKGLLFLNSNLRKYDVISPVATCIYIL